MYEFLNLVVIPLIIGMVEIIKRAGLPVRFAPIVAVAIGLFFGIFYLDTLKEGIIVGLMVGLSASGLYSGSKNLRNGNDYEKLNDKR